MRYRRIMLVTAWLSAGTALAQAPSDSSADWSLRPAAVGAVEYRLGSPMVLADAGSSPFRFSDGREGDVLNKPPPRPMDRAAVLGTERAWVGGRPPLDCAMTPLDARCH
ncbi:hypothetical protein [Rhodanobacter denitrificans]|uniref:Uncharacterized protein n=1 Tax=Rhodanobacter denitrificans TaxID=666685 RepID=M4NBH1_9GAMM|nr:hypothetical protein [Rhodanobacter denitrificans]AGG87985.1 hypothetical protein R2APBS1_0821 [Rhodanobacter denitrificans]UJM87138.1 hypothetical protein LRJ86_02165 [Rhodanobacter denitrificans]